MRGARGTRGIMMGDMRSGSIFKVGGRWRSKRLAGVPVKTTCDHIRNGPEAARVDYGIVSRGQLAYSVRSRLSALAYWQRAHLFGESRNGAFFAFERPIHWPDPCSEFISRKFEAGQRRCLVSRNAYVG